MTPKLTDNQRERQLFRLLTTVNKAQREISRLRALNTEQSHVESPASKAFDAMMLTPEVDKFLNGTLADIGSSSLKKLWDAES